MFDRFSDFSVEHIKSALLIIGIFLAVLIHIARRNNLSGLEKKLKRGLAVAAITSFMAFYNFGFFHFGGGHYHTHDLYHYYMGSKYFREVGYLYLYDATVLADEETTNYMAQVKRVRDQANYNYLPREAVHSQDRLKNWQPKFTVERWAMFKRDLIWFERQPHNWQWWEGIVNDFGYNPSPAWTMIAGVISNAIPTSFEPGMLFIAYLDGILALVMFYFLYRAFGAETALFSMLFWGATFAFVFSFTGASMLRHDWIVYLVISICLLKMKKPGFAGLFFALSSMLRIFPILFIFPVAAKFLIKTWQENKIDWRNIDWLEDWKKLDRDALVFFISVAGFILLIGLLTVIFVQGDWGSWPAFAEKMKVHEQSWNTWNWGFTDIFIYQGEVHDSLPGNWKEIKVEHLKDLNFFITTLQILTIAALCYAATRLEYWESLCLGGSMVFMFLNPTKYYFVHLITLMPLFSYRLEELWRLRSLCFLFGIMLLMYVVASFNETAILLQFIICSLIYLLYIFIFASLIYEHRKLRIDNVR